MTSTMTKDTKITTVLLSGTFLRRFGPSLWLSLPALLGLGAGLSGCFGVPASREVGLREPVPRPQLTVLEDRVQSWRLPLRDDELRGLRLLYDTPVPGGITLAIVRSATRANHRLDPFDALVFAARATGFARSRALDPGFFAATLLQESGFNPTAFSAAGAIGIAQFTLETAGDVGVDPFDWSDAMRGAALLLGRYSAAYAGHYPDPYAATLAAYNAGPGTVAFYRGVPPYPETRGYIVDIYDRWARLLRDAEGLPVKRSAHRMAKGVRHLARPRGVQSP